MILPQYLNPLLLLVLPLCSVAWTTTTTTTVSRTLIPVSSQQQQRQKQRSCRSNSCLYNIPPPSESNVAEFVQYASKQSPPSSFYELQQDCIRATRLARRDGYQLLEVEYPPLPANVLEMDDVSTYDVLQANLKLVIDYAKGLLASSSSPVTETTSKMDEQGASGTSSSLSSTSSTTTAQQQQQPIRKIAILLPDQAEADFTIEKIGSKNPFPGIVVTSIREVDPNDLRVIRPEQILLGLFGRGSGGAVKAIPDVDVYICISSSAQELPDIEELYNLDPTKTFILFNLKLDTLRGDLGAPAFPSKDFQDRFLSHVKPIYYLRTRQCIRSTPNPPFLVNFQGCLFRCYPGQYQTLLDTGTGRYRRVKGNDVRPALGTFKQELIDELIQQKVLQEEGSTFNFLRTGYKTTTWWEEDRPNAVSDDWKT